MKRVLILPLLTSVVLFASCSSGDRDSTATSASTASTATSVVETTTSIAATSTTVDDMVDTDTVDTMAGDATVTTETAATDDTATADTSDASTSTTLVDATETTDVVQGLAAEAIDVVVGGSNPARPTFEWTATTASPVRYQLVVQTADGTPVWAWTGTDTKTVLGGVERPADVEGPTLTGPSQVRVYAVAEDGSFAGVSPWVAIGPTTSPG